MTKYKRIKNVARPLTSQTTQMIVELANAKRFTASEATLITLATPAAVKTEAEKIIGKTTDLFIHKNRDGSWAVATGEEPRVWPEDEPKS